MKLPAWLADLAEDYGARRLAGKATRQDAVTALRDEIAANGDPAFLLALYADYAGRVLDAYQREHQYAAPPPVAAPLQAELFPDLKPRLYIRPGVRKPVMAMTGHDWDAARAMTLNRTKQSIEGAEADRKNFEKAYDRVRVHLKDGMTTADIVRELRGIVPLEGLENLAGTSSGA